MACLASFAVILFGSPLIGLVFGLSAGLISLFTSHVHVIEPPIVFVFGYLSFLSAEMFHLSGILSYVTFDMLSIELAPCGPLRAVEWSLGPIHFLAG